MFFVPSLAQLASVLDCGSRGDRFEQHRTDLLGEHFVLAFFWFVTDWNLATPEMSRPKVRKPKRLCDSFAGQRQEMRDAICGVYSYFGFDVLG